VLRIYCFIVFISDHGISNADTYVTFNYRDFEEEIFIGELVFFDSLYLSYWTKNRDVKAGIDNTLSYLPGKMLSLNQREETGLTSKKFGEGIFLLDEGYGFLSQFFWRQAAKILSWL